LLIRSIAVEEQRSPRSNSEARLIGLVASTMKRAEAQQLGFIFARRRVLNISLLPQA